MTPLASILSHIIAPAGAEAIAETIASPRAHVPMCVGGCNAIVSKRGDWCKMCGERDRAAMRATQLAPAYATLPDWPWARFTNPKFLQRIEAGGGGRMLQAARDWKTAHGHMTFIGRTGIGKTAMMTAVAHQILDLASERELSEKAMAVASGIRLISATDLADAAKRWPPRGADNAPLVQEALDATVLILDELGHEDPRDRSVFKVLDSRYRTRGKNTLITSRLMRVDMEREDRYGEDGARRIFDCGAMVVDMSRRVST